MKIEYSPSTKEIDISGTPSEFLNLHHAVNSCISKMSTFKLEADTKFYSDIYPINLSEVQFMVSSNNEVSVQDSKLSISGTPEFLHSIAINFPYAVEVVPYHNSLRLHKFS